MVEEFAMVDEDVDASSLCEGVEMGFGGFG
jgi:hypothetical protein